MATTARSHSERQRRNTRRWPGVGALVVTPVAVAVLAAACGGGSHHGATSSPISTTAQSLASQSASVVYASCMRSHGDSSFPDSAISVSGGQVEFDIPAGTKSESRFQSASRGCSRDLPGGGASAKPIVNIQEELEFANCLRAHGITDFPDPMPGGGFDIPGDTNSPQFQAAENSCRARSGSSGAHVGSNGS
jgi:hypothetical protein